MGARIVNVFKFSPSESNVLEKKNTKQIKTPSNPLQMRCRTKTWAVLSEVCLVFGRQKCEGLAGESVCI